MIHLDLLPASDADPDPHPDPVDPADPGQPLVVVAAPPSRGQHGGPEHAGALGSRVAVRIDGALDATILAGLDRLILCRPSRSGQPSDPSSCTVWPYRDVAGVRIGRYGSLDVVSLLLRHRAEPLPLLILEPGQGPAALDGLTSLQRLIAEAADLRPGGTDGHDGAGLDTTRRSA